VLSAVVVVLTSFSNISTIGNGRNHLRPPVIGRTVTVEVQRQRHSQVAKDQAPAMDFSPVIVTAKADTKKGKHYKPKVFARQPNNYGYGNALGMRKTQEVSFSADPAQSYPPLTAPA